VCVAIAVAALTSGTQAPSTTDYAISVSGPSPVHSLSFFLLWFPLFTRINTIYIYIQWSPVVLYRKTSLEILFLIPRLIVVCVFMYVCVFTWLEKTPDDVSKTTNYSITTTYITAIQRRVTRVFIQNWQQRIYKTQ